jgi:hypothetical protein
MGICCCLLDPQTNSHEPEVSLIERVGKPEAIALFLDYP